MPVPHLKTMFRRIDPLMALAQGVVVLTAFGLGGSLTSHVHETTSTTGAMLAAISGVVVLQENAREAVHQGWWRVLGTLLGAILATAYLSLMSYSLTGMVSMVVALIALCMMLSIPDNGKIATVTLIFIMMAARSYPDVPAWMNGLLRFTESTLGALTGIAVAWVVERIRLAGKQPRSGKTSRPGAGQSF